MLFLGSVSSQTSYATNYRRILVRILLLTHPEHQTGSEMFAIRFIVVAVVSLAAWTTPSLAESKPLKVFILAGQSNMVGWGNSSELPRELQTGNDKVLMFENGKWQPLRPTKKAAKYQQKLGLNEFSFGPEIAFGHEMSKAWPDEQIGIVKFAIGGTSILCWKPDWSKEDADRVGQGRMGSLYNALMSKVKQAGRKRDIEIVGFVWLQGGGDMKNVVVAKEYLDNLKSLVTSVRKETRVASLPFLCGSMRRAEDPDNLSKMVPKKREGRFPAVEWVLKAQWNVQKELSHTLTVILREIETHPMNVHFNTAGQLKVGKMFAEKFVETFTKSRAIE